MKRSEVTVEKLKALGYVAKSSFVNAWRFHSEEKELNKRQSEELFALTVEIVRSGRSVEIRRNNFRHTVEVTVRVADIDNPAGGPKIYYYLSRPMTEAEVLEANQFTGKWEEEQ